MIVTVDGVLLPSVSDLHGTRSPRGFELELVYDDEASAMEAMRVLLGGEMVMASTAEVDVRGVIMLASRVMEEREPRYHWRVRVTASTTTGAMDPRQRFDGLGFGRCLECNG